MGTNVKILSLNVGMSHSLAGLTTLIVSNCVDLVLLQEVTMSSEQLTAKLSSIGFNAEVNIDKDSPSSPGTAVAWRKSLPVNEVLPLVSCRVQLVKIGYYAILNIYAPSGTDRKQERHILYSQEVFKALCFFPDSTFLIAGDHNCILSPIDVENGTGYNQKYCSSLKDLIKTFHFVDAFRE